MVPQEAEGDGQPYKKMMVSDNIRLDKQFMAKNMKSTLKHYYQEEVENVVQPEGDHYDCICPKTTRDLQVSERTQTCYRCSRDYHLNCLWPSDETASEYECPLCFLRFCLPDRSVERVLFGGYLRQTKKNKIQYRINLPLESSLPPNLFMEARCVRLNRESKYELTWPQHCTLHLNHKKLAQFKPLPASSSIKHRIDQEILLERKSLGEENSLVIQQKHQYIEGVRKDSNSHHFVVIVLVKPLTAHEIQENLQVKHLSIDHSKNRLREYMNRGSQDCVVERLMVPLKCHFYSNKITIPVRSKHCRSHYQAFDLKGFIFANISSKSSVSKWKCPICKKRAYDLQIDEYLLKIIQSDTTLNEIYFNKQGQLQLFNQKATEREQPSVMSHESPQIFGQEEPRSESKQFSTLSSSHPKDVVKREVKIHSSIENHQYQEIPIDQSSQKSKIIFQECIEIMDDEGEEEEVPVPAPKPKRSYRARSNNYNFVQATTKTPKKKHKKESKCKQIQPVISQGDDSMSVHEVERAVEIYHSEEELRSDFDEEFNTKPDKKKKHKKNYIRERVGIEEPVRSKQKMAKTLIPSQPIRTVIPEAIRIHENKLPEPRKNQMHYQQAIQIGESQEDCPTNVLKKKIEYHMSELCRQYEEITNQEQEEITETEQACFYEVCQYFLTSVPRN